MKRWAGLSPSLAFVIVVACVLLGATFGILRERYWASASLEVAGNERREKERETSVVSLSYTDVKRFWSSSANSPALRSYIELTKNNPGDTDRLLGAASSDANWRQWIRPVYPLARADTKEFADFKQIERDQATTLFGIELRVDGSSEAVSINKVKLLRDYVANALVDNSMRDWVLAGRTTYESKRAELDADLIKADRTLSEMQTHVGDLKGILARYPDSARLESRQVVSVSSAEGTERFLSPVAQLVAAESAMSNQRIAIQNIERLIFQAALYRDFFEKASALYERPALARDRLKTIKGLAEQISAAGSTDIRAREIQNVLLASLQGYGALIERLSVQASPWAARDQLRNPVGGALLGLLLGVTLTVLWILLYRAFQPSLSRSPT